MRAILINPKNKTVELHSIDHSLESLQSAVGGTIAWGTQLKTGDVLYVDDEGQLKPDPSFFAMGRRTFAGCGLLVGPERPLITDVVSTVDEVAQLVSFDVGVDLDQPLTVKSTTLKSGDEFFDYLRRQRVMDCDYLHGHDGREPGNAAEPRVTEVTNLEDNVNLIAVAFMESAAMNLKATTSLLLESVEKTSRLFGTPESPVEHTIMVDALNPDLSIAFRLPLHVVIYQPALVSKIENALLRNKLRLKEFQVVAGFFMQPRLVLLIGRRVVGQLFSSRDGQSLQIEIEERPDARDMGNAVLALGRLEFNVHTPLGSPRADGTQ